LPKSWPSSAETLKRLLRSQRNTRKRRTCCIRSEAQERKGGVKLTYSGATGEQPSDLSSDLPGIDADARRAIVEAEREAPPEARTPWWKTFFPDRTFAT